jgi:hypothetical protein
MIQLLSGHTRTPRKHFFQQSIYTVCESRVGGKWQFDSHQKVFDNRRPNQDYPGKFDIPSTERERILGLLDRYNLNAYSLLESEESLLEPSGTGPTQNEIYRHSFFRATADEHRIVGVCQGDILK